MISRLIRSRLKDNKVQNISLNGRTFPLLFKLASRGWIHKEIADDLPDGPTYTVQRLREFD